MPGIWATNAAAAMDPAILRRFVMAVELPPLDESRRAAVWVREAGSELSLEEATRLARRFEVSPASITGAIRAARLIGSGRVDGTVAEEVLAGNVAATGAPPNKPPPSGLRYEPGLLNASMDLDVLAKRLESAGPSAHATICLHGPPGTGKSEWVRHLAARLRRKIHVHAVSDIESKYVGESETNLARAFERAEQENAILLFDEADSFLLDRRHGQRRWEISLTNEFLQRLEAARGIVACTTNAFDRLDPAVMRRFSIKVGLDYLKPEAAVRLFAVAFGPHPSEAWTTTRRRVSPGGSGASGSSRRATSRRCPGGRTCSRSRSPSRCWWRNWPRRSRPGRARRRRSPDSGEGDVSLGRRGLVSLAAIVRRVRRRCRELRLRQGRAAAGEAGLLRPGALEARRADGGEPTGLREPLLSEPGRSVAARRTEEPGSGTGRATAARSAGRCVFDAKAVACARGRYETRIEALKVDTAFDGKFKVYNVADVRGAMDARR